MNLLEGNIKRIYLKYLAASFGSALIVSVYGLVDTAMVGQYHGPLGAAAMAVVAPLWNLIYSLGLLVGIGGSILFATVRGSGRADGSENEYFSAALIGTAILSTLLLGLFWGFETPLLRLFGADASLIPIVSGYLLPVKCAVPVFLLNQLLSGFLRNDGNPSLATKAVLLGGLFNIVGDYFFVFTCDMGAFGAGLATVIGSILTLLVLLTHFLRPANTLRLRRPRGLWKKLKRLSQAGFSSFFVDVAMGILTILFNRQIMHYAGGNALAVYGILVNVATFVQCCAYGVGQAAQPILSVNFGAGRQDRIAKLLRYNLITVAIVGIFWTILIFTSPAIIVRLFMTPSPAVLEIAPMILRLYGISFLLLPLNIYSTYYFQSLLRPGRAFLISVTRGALLSAALILLLPLFLGSMGLWLAMPICELLVAALVIGFLLHDRKTAKKSPQGLF